MYHYRMYFAVVLAVILSNAAFGTPFRILDPRFQYANKDTTKTKGKSSDLELTETSFDDGNDFNNSVPRRDFNMPMPEEVMAVDSTEQRQFFHEPPSYPSFYTANSENTLPVENSLPETYQNGNPYNAYPYYPSVQSFPTPHPYILEDIRYVPAYQELYNYIHHQPMNTPLPYAPTASSNPGPSGTVFTDRPPCKMDKVTDNTPYLQASFTDRTPYNVDIISSHIQTNNSENELARPTTNAAIEDYMMKKILEIVNDLSRSNLTLKSGHSSRDDTYLPRKNMSIVATTSVNQNNTTRIESTIGFDETETEIHSDGNRTVTSEIGQKMQPSISTTVGPQRYLVRQFTDKKGNPCMEELVTTSGKKLYSVYTCENKGIPRKTTTFSNVASYRDEIKPDSETTADTKTDDETVADTKTDDETTAEMKKDEPATTTPMTADQTLPPVLNDYAIFNMQQ